MVRGGHIVSAQGVEEADIGIAGGKIAAIGSLGAETAEEVIEARNLLVLPGLIDTQVHFREPGMEYKEDIESGTRSAIHGGVTTIFEMPNTFPATTGQKELADKLRRAAGRAWCDYGFFIGATKDNLDQLDKLEMLEGTPGVKIFMGSSTGSLLLSETEDLRKALTNGSRRIAVHAEDEQRLRERKTNWSGDAQVSDHPEVRDSESARIATERLLSISRETGRPVHVLHVSTADELPLIAEAKASGNGRVTAEVTPQHLYFAAPLCYERFGTRVQMNPPIRSEQHRRALWEAFHRGLFDVFGSDHAPHTKEEKDRPYPQSPSGMPGVQTMLPVLMTFVSVGRLTLQNLAKMSSEAPASIYGIRDKGRISEGFDADIVLVDPSAVKTVESGILQSKCGWSPYEGQPLTGWPTRVLLRGKTVVQDGETIGSPSGRPVNYTWKG